MEKDFISGMKVWLDGEFGVIVTSESDIPNFSGIIRWDTEKEFDFEDWRGMFASFLNLGGKIVSENHEFKYINDDETLKTEEIN